MPVFAALRDAKLKSATRQEMKGQQHHECSTMGLLLLFPVFFSYDVTM
jgi:hypothetical protein